MESPLLLFIVFDVCVLDMIRVDMSHMTMKYKMQDEQLVIRHHGYFIYSFFISEGNIDLMHQ